MEKVKCYFPSTVGDSLVSSPPHCPAHIELSSSPAVHTYATLRVGLFVLEYLDLCHPLAYMFSLERDQKSSESSESSSQLSLLLSS
jgi:hypothetical protein